jgi:hypothetical protein
MTNAFNWKQFTTEERIKRGEKPDAINTSSRRSQSSAKAIARKRIDTPSYGTIGVFANGTTSQKEIR